MTTLGLEADYGGEELVSDHRIDRKPGTKHQPRKRRALYPGGHPIRPLEPADIQALRSGPVNWANVLSVFAIIVARQCPNPESIAGCEKRFENSLFKTWIWYNFGLVLASKTMLKITSITHHYNVIK